MGESSDENEDSDDSDDSDLPSKRKGARMPLPSISGGKAAAAGAKPMKKMFGDSDEDDDFRPSHKPSMSRPGGKKSMAFFDDDSD